MMQNEEEQKAEGLGSSRYTETLEEGKSKRGKEREGLEDARQKGTDLGRVRRAKREEQGDRGGVGTDAGEKGSFVQRWEIVVDK